MFICKKCAGDVWFMAVSVGPCEECGTLDFCADLAPKKERPKKVDPKKAV